VRRTIVGRLATIARQVGYASPFALSSAFKQTSRHQPPAISQAAIAKKFHVTRPAAFKP
jgi:AraC-like DNA-binding protein